MRRHIPVIVLLLSSLSTPMAARAQPSDELRLPVTRDTWVSNVGDEAKGNNGAASRLKTKGIQEFSIVDIDPVPLRGRVIKSATLHLKPASADFQKRVTVSTLASPWNEGTSSNYKPDAKGASFLAPGNGASAWTNFGGDLTQVMNGAGYTIWSFADATMPDKTGYQHIAVDPRIVAARVAGLSEGFVVFDDTGSEYTRKGEAFVHHLFPNRFLHSRESGAAHAPYFTVTLGERDDQPPEAVKFIKATTQPGDPPLAPGEYVVRWITPRDLGSAGVIGFRVQIEKLADAEGAFQWTNKETWPMYEVPLAGSRGDTVTLRHRVDARGYFAMQWGTGKIQFTVRAIDAAGNVGPPATSDPIVTGPARTIDIPPLTQPTTKPASSGSPRAPIATPAKPPLPALNQSQVFILDPLDKIHPVTGKMIPARSDEYRATNHLWSAADATVRLRAARNDFVAFQIVISEPVQGLTARLTFPDADNAPIRTKLYRFRHVNTKFGPLPDPLVPIDATTALSDRDEKIEGQTYVSVLAEVYVPHAAPPGERTGTLRLRIGDQSLDLKINLHVWNFTLPDHLSFVPEMNCYGLPGPAGGAESIAYYRLAHEHRTCLNRLAYNWQGRVNDGHAPKISPDGKIFDWKEWDQRFGPLFDGSAFRDLPRGAVPVETFYLPINENWPMSIDRGFRGGYWADTALTKGYRDELVDAAEQFARHFHERLWSDTLFEFYLNNKVQNKKPGWSKSSAPWTLDEPVNTQDFWALRWYGLAFHEGVAQARARASVPLEVFPKMAFRADISRPQWQRDLLDGVLDVNIVGGVMHRYQQMVLDRKLRNGEFVQVYGSSNAIDRSNVQPAAWCIDAWTLGADGVLPWQTVGNEKSWTQADALSLFYPGKTVGVTGPVASVRLKSYRQGQQDVEYLTIYQRATGVPRTVLAAWVREQLRLSASDLRSGEDDAGTIDFGALDPAALWSLRLRLGAALGALGPPAKRQWVDLRTPPRDPKQVAAIIPIDASSRKVPSP